MSGSGRRKPNLRSSVYQGRDGKWHGWVTMGVRADGKPDRRHREGATEAEVTRKVRELEGKRDAGKTSKPGRVPTLAQWMRTFIEEIAPQRVAQSTIDSTYRPKIQRWIIPKLGGHRLDRLCPEHLYKFYGSLRKEGLAPNTILQIHRILSRALSIAVREELIGRNPCRLIDAPQHEEPENETLTAAEARALLALTAGRRNGTRWSVAPAARRPSGCLAASTPAGNHARPAAPSTTASARSSASPAAPVTPRHARSGKADGHSPGRRATAGAPSRSPCSSSRRCASTSRTRLPGAKRRGRRGRTGIWCGASRTGGRSTRTTTGTNGKRSWPRPALPRTPGCTTPGTPRARCWK